MTTPVTIRVALALLVVLLPAAHGFAKKETSRNGKPPAMPFECFVEKWQDNFEVSKPVYDRSTCQLTWILEPKKDAPVGRYEAFLADGDGVEVSTTQVTITPERPVRKEARKFRATVALPRFEIENVCKVIIRPVR